MQGPVATAAVYSAAFVALGMIVSSLGPTLPGLAARTGTTLGAVSVLFVARSSGYFLGALGGGTLYDRLRGHPVLATTLVVMALAMSAAPAATNLVVLAAIMLAIGLAEGTLDVGVNTLVVWKFRDRSGPYLNAVHFFFAVGAFVSPMVVARAIAATGDISWAYWVLALYLVPVAVWLWAVPSPAPSIRSDADAPERVIGRSGPLLALIVTFYFVYIGAEASYGGWIYSYAYEMRLEDETGAAYLTSVFWGALAAGRLVTIPVAARVRPRFILVATLAAAITSIAVVLAVPGSVWAVRAGSAGAGFAMAAIFPTMLALAGRHVRITGKVNSLIFAGASAGSIAFPWLIGQLLEPFGIRSVMVVILACAVAAMGVLGVVLAVISARERAGRRT